MNGMEWNGMEPWLVARVLGTDGAGSICPPHKARLWSPASKAGAYILISYSQRRGLSPFVLSHALNQQSGKYHANFNMPPSFQCPLLS